MSNSDLFNLIYIYIFPVVMTAMGVRYRLKTPDFPSPNDTSKGGYRSKMARGSKEAWEFAHKTVSLWWIVFGGIMLIVTLLLTKWMLTAENVDLAAVELVFVQIIVTVAPPMIITEVSLRKRFDAKGNPKQ